jgi:hypothetical protein
VPGLQPPLLSLGLVSHSTARGQLAPALRIRNNKYLFLLSVFNSTSVADGAGSEAN